MFVLINSVCYSQIKTEEQSLVLRTFGFIQGQKSTLSNIKEKFPKQSIEAEIAELEFINNYGRSLSNINLEVRKILGKQFQNYVLRLDKETNTYFNSKFTSEQAAISFIEKVKNRAKGNIQDPYLSVLNEYSNDSANQLSADYNLYEVKSYFNSRVIELKVKVPQNWKEIDGLHGSVLKKFKSDYGTGNEIITIGRINTQSKLKPLTTKWLLEFYQKAVH